MAGKLDALKQSFSAHADRSLGMGPGASSADVGGAIQIPERLVGLTKIKDAAEIAIERIAPDKNQPREHFDEEALGRLGESIMARGILQPLRVRWEEPRYVIVAGERRWRAAQLAGLKTVPCIIHQDSLTADEIMVLQLQENLLREDLKPLEQATGFRKLMEARGWSANKLSKELSIPVSTVTRALELLDLPPAVQDLVDTGALAPSTACEIGRLEDSEEKVKLAKAVAVEKLTKAAVIEQVREKKAEARTPSQSSKLSKAPSKQIAAPVCSNLVAAPGPGLEHQPPIDQPASHESASTARPVEIVVSNGRKVIVVGAPAGAGPEALLEILQLAVDKLKAEVAATV